MDRDICVLLSTYNGEKYLREQVDSILDQNNVEINLLVRDDGSKDRTIDILNTYQCEGKLTVLENAGNLGPANSFMELLYNSPEADYYAFADQDDIWLPEKLQKAINLIERKSKSSMSTLRGERNVDIPVLYASNQILYFGNGETKLRFKEAPDTTLTGIICGNHISGCTMVFNKKLRDILIDKHNRSDEEVLKLRMHDTWVAAVAASCGEVIYDEESFILYRIHEDNTVGIDSGTFQKRLGKMFRKIKKVTLRNGRSRIAKELLKINDVDQKSKKIIEDFADSRKNRIRILHNTDIKRDCPENRYVFMIKALLGWH